MFGEPAAGVPAAGAAADVAVTTGDTASAGGPAGASAATPATDSSGARCAVCSSLVPVCTGGAGRGRLGGGAAGDTVIRCTGCPCVHCCRDTSV